MHQVPTPAWNQIAATQTLRHPEMASLFKAEGIEFLEKVDAMEKQVDLQSKDSRVTRAFVLVAPLLFETAAISRFVEMQQTPSLRAGLPELTTISEAVDLATQEFSLTPGQRAKLRGMLKSGLSQ